MTTYVLANSWERARNTVLDFNESPMNKKFIYITPYSPYALEGRNIVPGDSVLFCDGTTVDQIERFVMQAASRGTQLSDLRIIHK